MGPGQFFHCFVNKIPSRVVYDLSADLARPQQQTSQGIADFIFRQLGDLSDLSLSLCATANGFAHAIGWGKLSQHARDASRRKNRFRIDWQTGAISRRSAMFDPRLLVFAQGLTAEGNLLTNAALAIKIEAIFTRATNSEF